MMCWEQGVGMMTLSWMKICEGHAKGGVNVSGIASHVDWPGDGGMLVF